MTKERLKNLFGIEKPIIGMIHLAGENEKERVTRALEELTIYQENEVDGAIIEDYHGTAEDILPVLTRSLGRGYKIIRGVNVLRCPYSSFPFANSRGKFVQFDSVQTQDLNVENYNKLRGKYPEIFVFGGVEFKGKQPTGNPLKKDLEEAKTRCDAIVTTGPAIGFETPVEKLLLHREILEDFPLIVGAGVTPDNVYDSLSIADGAIVGSCFKPEGDTMLPVDPQRVHDLMDVVREIRANS
jgi:predicted TIM-barrel enzyme